MKYSIIGTGNVGQALASLFAKSGIEVAIANTRGPESIALLAKELGAKVVAKSLDEALQADIIFFAVQFLNFKDVGALRSNWAGKIIVDVTNAAFLPQDVQDKELKGRLSSEVTQIACRVESW